MANNQIVSLDHQLLGMTTIIECHYGSTMIIQGSGFYYSDLAPGDPSKQGGQWRLVNGTWLVTNRHVAFPRVNDKEVVPDTLIFNLRKVLNDKVEWLPITFSKAELIQRTKIHPNDEVDVVAIKIDDVLIDLVKNHQEEGLISPRYLTSDNLPENSPLQIDVTSDIVIASYPRGYYDTFNKFPIVKSGIVASSWNCLFNGLPVFLVDAQLLPGSSGGLVISKPVNIAMIEGHVKYNETKQFVLLGVYSGEPIYTQRFEMDDMVITRTKSFGLGNVWYSSLIPEIINGGQHHPNS